MGTNHTPIYQLPWPDGAERVMDGDNAIGALATAIDGILGTLAIPPAIGRCSANLTLSTTEAAVPSAVVTWTATGPEVVLVGIVADISIGTAPVFAQAYAKVDGTVRTGNAILNAPTSATRATVGQITLGSHGSGTHTAQMYGSQAAAGGVSTIVAVHTALVVVRFRAAGQLRDELLDALGGIEALPASGEELGR